MALFQNRLRGQITLTSSNYFLEALNGFVEFWRNLGRETSWMLWRSPFSCKFKKNWAGRRDYQMGTNTANAHMRRELRNCQRKFVKGRPVEHGGLSQNGEANK